MPTSITSGDNGSNELSTPSTVRTPDGWPALDHRIADDPALTGMNDARRRAFAAADFAGYQPHAARAAVAGAAVIGQVDAVAQSSVQQ